MRIARVKCCIPECPHVASISYDDAGVTGRTESGAFAQAADDAGWLIGNETLPTGEVVARDRCPEHRLAPLIAEVLGAPV